MVVDAHAHLWPAGAAEIPAALTDLERAMQAAGVDGAVLVQPHQPAISAEYLQSAAAAAPGRFAVVGRVELIPETHTWRLPAEPCAGYRLNVWRAPELLSVGGWQPAVEHLLSLGVPVCVLLQPEQLTRLRVCLDATRPCGPVIVDHLARLTLGNGPAAAALPALLALADVPAVHVKLSGLAALSGQGPPWMNLSELVVRVLATFGAERVLWGSDFPYLRPGLSYADNLTGARALLAGLDAAAVENVLGGNARRLWWSGAAAPSGME